jgi:hypothetical protein
VKLKATPVGLNIIRHGFDELAGPEMSVTELAFQSLEGCGVFPDNVKFHPKFVT